MKAKIINFYERFDLEITKQIARRPRSIAPAQIEKACVVFYNLVDHNEHKTKEDGYIILKSGEIVKTILIVRRIQNLAEFITAKEYAESWEPMRNIKALLAQKDMEYDQLALMSAVLLVCCFLVFGARFL